MCTHALRQDIESMNTFHGYHTHANNYFHRIILVCGRTQLTASEMFWVAVDLDCCEYAALVVGRLPRIEATTKAVRA